MATAEGRGREEQSVFEREVSRRTAIKYAAGALAGLPVLANAATASARPRIYRSLAGQAAQGTLRVATSWGGADATEVLDPASPKHFYEPMYAIYNRLVRENKKFLPAPDLAVSWTPNGSADQWTFKLREGVAFHDGKPFTSEDVAYTFAHLVDPKLGSGSLTVFGPLIDPSNITTPDAHTVVFKLKKPHADFPVLCLDYATCIIPADSADTIGKTGIGTGPFQVEEFTPGAKLTVSAYSNYWGGPPNLSEVIFTAIEDAQARTNALLAGQLDLLFADNLDPAAAKVIAATPGFVIQEHPTGYWVVMAARADRRPFTDARVRRAMKMVVDPHRAIQGVMGGHGVPAGDNPVWTGDPYRLHFTPHQDIAGAKKLLAEAGHKHGIEVTLHTSAVNGNLIPLAVVYQQMAKKAGINVHVKEDPTATYWDGTDNADDMFMDYWGQRPADTVLSLFFRAGSPDNEDHWKNPKIGQLIDAARRELNFAKRRAIYQHAQRIAIAESGMIVPFFENRLRGMSKHVKNVPMWAEYPDWRTIALV